MTFRSLWQRFRDFDRRGLLVARVNGHLAFTQRGYVINRRIFQAYLLVVILCLALVAYTYRDVGVRSLYFRCDINSTTACENPCYGESDCGVYSSLQNVRYIPPGEGFGNPPDEGYQKAVRDVWGVVILGLVAAFLVNHAAHNRGRPFKYLFPKLEVEQ